MNVNHILAIKWVGRLVVGWSAKVIMMLPEMKKATQIISTEIIQYTTIEFSGNKEVFVSLKSRASSLWKNGENSFTAQGKPRV